MIVNFRIVKSSDWMGRTIKDFEGFYNVSVLCKYEPSLVSETNKKFVKKDEIIYEDMLLEISAGFRELGRLYDRMR